MVGVDAVALVVLVLVVVFLPFVPVLLLLFLLDLIRRSILLIRVVAAGEEQGSCSEEGNGVPKQFPGHVLSLRRRVSHRNRCSKTTARTMS